MIEGQNDTMAKLREMLHQSQLKQLHVCEGRPGREASLEGVPFSATVLILLVLAAQCQPFL